ncbi:LysR substrate-binding domain-containing protein [Tsuneonella sp. HG249]
MKIAGSHRPTLNALKTLEAVGRLKSLTLAAHELNVSVSAVAFQINAAETAFRRSLVERQGRGLHVPQETELLAQELGAAFHAIDAAVGRFARSPAAVFNVVTVAVLPSFAALWLLPRLSHFWASYPEIDVRITASDRKADLLSEGIDCAVRVGAGEWQGLQAKALFPQVLTPVCHFSYLKRFRAPATPGDLKDHLLIHDTLREKEWSEWFTAVGGPIRFARLQEVQGRGAVGQAVTAGLGIGLVDVSIHEDRIRRGEIVRLFPWDLDTEWKHWLVTPEGEEPSDVCKLFISWLESQKTGRETSDDI